MKQRVVRSFYRTRFASAASVREVPQAPPLAGNRPTARRHIGSDLDSLGVQTTSLGYISDTEDLRAAYSAADVFVAPSRMNAFGKTLVEAMLCGTPVVCFDATGPKDFVEHRTTGYLAEPFSPEDLARGIRWVLEQPSGLYAETGAAALRFARDCTAIYRPLPRRHAQCKRLMRRRNRTLVRRI